MYYGNFFYTSAQRVSAVLQYLYYYYYYALPLIGGGIKQCFCLTSVWHLSVVYIGPKLRTERPRKTKIGTEVAHVTRDSDTTFKVKGQGHQAALLFTYLTCKAVAAVSVGMYLAWESIARWCAAGGGEEVGAYCVATCTACYYFSVTDVPHFSTVFLDIVNFCTHLHTSIQLHTHATIVSPPNVPVHNCWEMRCLVNACRESVAALSQSMQSLWQTIMTYALCL